MVGSVRKFEEALSAIALGILNPVPFLVRFLNNLSTYSHP